jgi:hypothetical protein
VETVTPSSFVPASDFTEPESNVPACRALAFFALTAQSTTATVSTVPRVTTLSRFVFIMTLSSNDCAQIFGHS